MPTNSFINVDFGGGAIPPSLTGWSLSGNVLAPTNQGTIVIPPGLPIFTVQPIGGGADDAPNIETAITAAKTAGGGIVQLIAGEYSIQTDINPAGQDYMCGVWVVGAGPETELSIDDDLTSAVFHFNGGTPLHDVAIDNTTAGASSITTTTHSDAAAVKTGDIIAIRGTDTNGDVDAESYHIASANGNGTTGVISLVNKVLKTLTSATLVNDWGAETQTASTMSNGVFNLTIKMNATPAAAFAGIALGYQKDFTISGVRFEGFNLNLNSAGADAPIVASNCLGLRVWDVQIEGSKNQGFYLNRTFMNDFRNVQMINVCSQGGTAPAGLWMRDTYDSCFDGITVLSSGANGINLSGAGNPNRRCHFTRVKMEDIENTGFRSDFSLNCSLDGAEFERVPNDAAVNIQPSNGKFLARGVQARFCANGVLLKGCFSTQILDSQFTNCISYGILAFQNAVDVAICNNLIQKGSGGDGGIVLSDTTDSKVNNNQVLDITGKAIELQGTCTANQINGNLIRNSSSDAIKLSNGSDYNQVGLNMAKGLTITTGTATHNEFTANLV